MTIFLPALIPLLSLLNPLAPLPDCEYTAPRSVTLPVSGAQLLRLQAAAGSLRVEGRPGLTEVRVRGTACSSDRDYLETIQLATSRDGGELRVEVVMPERERGWDDLQARLDLVVEVPQSLALDVRDSSGEAEFRGVGPLHVDDSSGDLEIADVGGDLRVRDSSGAVNIRGVRGQVVLEDSSGDLEVDGVEGSVLVERDSSGGIRVADVSGSVHVRRDSSGDIRVEGIRGDFVVESDGSGGIRYSDIGGSIRIPERKRR